MEGPDHQSFCTPSPLALRMWARDGVTRVELRGELDVSSAPELVAATEGLAQSDAREVVLELGMLEFCDAGGLAAVLRLRDDLRATGKRLRLTGLTPHLRRLLGIMGLTDLLAHRSTRPCGVDPRDTAAPWDTAERVSVHRRTTSRRLRARP